MLIIRQNQLDLFDKRAGHEYEERLHTRLWKRYPEEAHALGEQPLRNLIRRGVSRSKQYGLESERDVALFVDLMLFLGPRFDQDPGLPWVSEILNDEYIIDPGLRIDTLHENAIQWLETKGFS